jgi:DNA-binding PadR family transcriptional regulator
MGTKSQQLGEFEMMVMLAILHLGDDAYAVSIRTGIEERAGRPVSRGAVYITLRRLSDKGYLASWWGEPTPERGGKAKRHYTITEAGLEALQHSREAMRSMWRGLEPLLERRQ